MSTFIKNNIAGSAPRHITIEDFDMSRAKRAVKVAKIHAALLTEDTDVITQMTDGHIETKNLASAGRILVSNPDGDQYALSQEKFVERYGEWRGDGEYDPQSAPITYMRIDEDVTLDASWGERRHIKAGGVIALESTGDAIYGIQPEAFAKTYQDVPVENDEEPLV